MNEPRVIVCAQCGNSWNEPLFIHTCLAVPRVAESLDDLAVGMVVAWESGGGRITGGTIHGFGERCLVTNDGNIWEEGFSPVHILADPPAPPARDWLVPADTMEALREAAHPHSDEGSWFDNMRFAIDAVLDAATEVER